MKLTDEAVLALRWRQEALRLKARHHETKQVMRRMKEETQRVADHVSNLASDLSYRQWRSYPEPVQRPPVEDAPLTTGNAPLMWPYDYVDFDRGERLVVKDSYRDHTDIRLGSASSSWRRI